MLLKRIILEDFGLFRGRNEIDLTPRIRSRQRRPVVLIGGKNGSGKTTVLDALRLSLYGPMALGTRVSTREYEAYLSDRIHRSDNSLFKITGAGVSVEFDYAQAGVIATYRVERRWEHQGNGVRVALTVTRNGSPLDELDHGHADEFLRDLIPQGVSQLFFFDGEKIQQLADGEQDHAALADAVRSLIGLDHVERLGSDLRIYASRLQDSPTADPLKEQQQSLVKEKEALESRRIEAVRELDQAQSQEKCFIQELSREEKKLANSGGVFASRREALLAERNQIRLTIKELESEVRNLAEGLLPFVMSANLCRTLKTQLSGEKQILNSRASESAFRERLDRAKSGIDEVIFPSGQDEGLSKSVRKRLRQRIEQFLDLLVVSSPDLPSIPVIHRISDEERERLVGFLSRVEGELPSQLTAIQSKLEGATRRLQEIEDALGKVPDEDALRPLLESIQDLNRRKASAEVMVKRCEAGVKEIDNRLEEINRQLRRIGDKLADVNSIGGRGVLVGKVQGALDSFARVLTEEKVNELRDAVVRSFGRLWRKGDVVKRIEFDPTDLRVTLFDRHDRPLPKQRLSAGEKQIYAIALLWALAQVSGRPLPVIIDTPLGRLDQDHRSNLVTRYFPHASHQVVVLSTDTEIDKSYFQELSPTVSHSYHLRYVEAEARSVVEEGYFWTPQGKEVAGAIE